MRFFLLTLTALLVQTVSAAPVVIDLPECFNAPRLGNDLMLWKKGTDVVLTAYQLPYEDCSPTLTVLNYSLVNRTEINRSVLPGKDPYMMFVATRTTDIGGHPTAVIHDGQTIDVMDLATLSPKASVPYSEYAGIINASFLKRLYQVGDKTIAMDSRDLFPDPGNFNRRHLWMNFYEIGDANGPYAQPKLLTSHDLDDAYSMRDDAYIANSSPTVIMHLSRNSVVPSPILRAMDVFTGKFVERVYPKDDFITLAPSSAIWNGQEVAVVRTANGVEFLDIASLQVVHYLDFMPSDARGVSVMPHDKTKLILTSETHGAYQLRVDIFDMKTSIFTATYDGIFNGDECWALNGRSVCVQPSMQDRNNKMDFLDLESGTILETLEVPYTWPAIAGKVLDGHLYVSVGQKIVIF